MPRSDSLLRTAFPFQADCDQHHFRHSDTRHSIDRMNAQQMQRLKTLLEIRQHELRLSINHHLQYARRVGPEPDTVDQAASGAEKESLLQRSSREQQLLRTIDSALGRIRDRTYGKCLSCGKQIDGRRLAAVPWTPYCIQCEEEFEQ
jgi:DnaK suppressor protein